MMYIEQAPLGGNLLQILKNSASLSNGTAPKVNGNSPIQNGTRQKTFAKPVKTIEQQKVNERVDLALAKESLAVPDEEEERYELIDIIDEQEKSDLEGQGYEIEINIGDLKQTTEGNDVEEYEYQLVKVTRRKTQDQPADLIPLTEPKKILRPVPDAIPIDLFEKNHQNKRLLNGISKEPAVTSACATKRKVLNGSCAPSYLTGRSSSERFDEQMGIDILSGLRKLFNWKTKEEDSNRNSEPTETQTGKRKRRSENQAPVAHFKYRRVENTFPEIITQSLDDDIDFSPIYPKPRLNTQQFLRETTKQSQLKSSKLEMTQRGTEQKSRHSWFKIPQITKKTVRNNTSYADYEFSDDEDDETRKLKKILGLPSLNGGTVRKQPKVINIPIRQEQQTSTSFFKPTLSAPDSIFTLGSISKPSYADVLKYNSGFGNSIGNVLNGHSLSSNASTGSGASTSRLGHDYGNMARLSNKALGRSILAQDREKEEHEKYKQLLDTINRAQAICNYPSNTHLLGNVNKKPRVSSKLLSPVPMARLPLSSTINIGDDEDYDEVAITGVTHLKSHKSSKKRDPPRLIPTVMLDSDDDISEIIDLGKEHSKKKTAEIIDLDAKENKRRDELPYVEPVNSFRDILNTIPHLKDNWLKNFSLKWEEKKKLREAEVNKTLEITEKLTAERRAADAEIRERLQDFRIVDPELLVVDDFAEPEVEKEPEFPELTEDRLARINAAACGPPDQVLVEKFNMKITRRDIQTLLGHNWLNDEVINFYMNLITERSEIKHKTHGYPTVYAMNTFFLQRLSQNGHGGVKRWTRKVNIFEKDVLPVPVHVGGVHWCMAIIHMKNRWIRYYDSMGAPNPGVLKLLEQYLKDESLDKRKQEFDTSNFVIESVRDVPRQMNGSDCGVFSCMFAEYVSRNKEITFAQQQMEYFRHKMILEIVQGELLL